MLLSIFPFRTKVDRKLRATVRPYTPEQGCLDLRHNLTHPGHLVCPFLKAPSTRDLRGGKSRLGQRHLTYLAAFPLPATFKARNSNSRLWMRLHSCSRYLGNALPSRTASPSSSCGSSQLSTVSRGTPFWSGWDQDGCDFSHKEV